jgi:hypothetical protein
MPDDWLFYLQRRIVIGAERGAKDNTDRRQPDSEFRARADTA